MIKTCVIFAGGLGTRLMPITETVPKPLVNIGNRPILWHLIKYLSVFGVRKFVIATGYKHEKVVEYWTNYWKSNPKELGIKQEKGKASFSRKMENWETIIKNTGFKNGTASRLMQIKDNVDDDKFMVAYGDNLADIDINALENAYEKSSSKGRLGVISVYRPISRFGVVKFNGDAIEKFTEKPRLDHYINIGFMVFSKEIFPYMEKLGIKPDDMIEPVLLTSLAKQGKLGHYKHEGFWEPMDAYRDYMHLNKLWEENKAPWRKW